MIKKAGFPLGGLGRAQRFPLRLASFVVRQWKYKRGARFPARCMVVRITYPARRE